MRIDLLRYVNAAAISAADGPHIVVEKLQKAINASLESASDRDATLEEAAKACDDLSALKWSEYKTGHGPGRANPQWQGESDGASMAANAIRALKKAAPQASHDPSSGSSGGDGPAESAAVPQRAEDQDFSIFGEALALTEKAISPVCVVDDMREALDCLQACASSVFDAYAEDWKNSLRMDLEYAIRRALMVLAAAPAQVPAQNAELASLCRDHAYYMDTYNDHFVGSTKAIARCLYDAAAALSAQVPAQDFTDDYEASVDRPAQVPAEKTP